MKLYLAGPMRGYDSLNFPAFDTAARSLRAQGHMVWNPAEYDRNNGFDPGRDTLAPLRYYMKVDLFKICEWADAVAVLNGWDGSQGASLEVEVARRLEIPVIWHRSLQPVDEVDITNWNKFNSDRMATVLEPKAVEAPPPQPPRIHPVGTTQDIPHQSQVICPKCLGKIEDDTHPALSDKFKRHQIIEVDKGSPNLELTETRITDPTTGGEKGQKIARFDLIPVEPLWEVAVLFGVGAQKYAERNWERGYKWSLSYAALERHLNLFWKGEDYDPPPPGGTGRHHLASVVFHAMALMEYGTTHPELDDRPKGKHASKTATPASRKI